VDGDDVAVGEETTMSEFNPYAAPEAKIERINTDEKRYTFRELAFYMNVSFFIGGCFGIGLVVIATMYLHGL
jgi:hypothetical protein